MHYLVILLRDPCMLSRMNRGIAGTARHGAKRELCLGKAGMDLPPS